MQRTTLLIALACLVAGAQAADVYKWTDASGVVHYADTEPPAEAKAERVHVVGMVTAATPAADKNADSDDEAAGDDGAPKKQSDDAAAFAQQRCDHARQDLELLQSNQPVALDPARTGKPAEPLDDKQRQAQIANAQTLIAQNCK